MDQQTAVWKRLYIAEIILIGVAVCVLALGRELWFDETFTIAISKCSFSDIISYTSGDVHPPLYYFIVKIFTMILGQHMVIYRLASVIPFVLTLLLVGKFCKNNFGYKEAMLTVLIISGAPQMLTYAVEIRMYAWCNFFVVLSMILAFSIYEKDSVKKWLALSVVNAMAAYTHYFAGAAVILVSLYLFLLLLYRKEHRKGSLIKWLFSMMFTVVLYFPWLIVFYRQLSSVREGYWIEGIRVSTLESFARFVFGNQIDVMRILLQVLFVIAVCMLLFYWNNEKKDTILFGCGFVFFGYIGMGVVLSLLIAPVFVKRYIVIVLPLFWLAVTCCLCQAKNRKIYLTLGLVGALMFAVNYEQEFDHRVSDDNISGYYYLESNLQPGDVIYGTSQYVMAEMTTYFPDMQVYLPSEVLKDEAFQRWDEITNCVMTESAQSFCQQGLTSVWLLEYNDQDNTVQVFQDNGYDVRDIGKQTLGWDGWDNNNIEINVYHCTKE